jgi:hypothetical protein
MTPSAPPDTSETNFTFSLLAPIERDFELTLERGCFQKKSLLTRLFEIEIGRLDEAIDTPLPKEVTQYIRDVQNDGQLKESWSQHQVQLPSSLVRQIQHVCKLKGVIRDAWVNRVLFLATYDKLFNTFLRFDDFEKFEYFVDDQSNKQSEIDAVRARINFRLDPLNQLHAFFEMQGEIEPSEDEWNLYRYRLFDEYTDPRTRKPPLKDVENDKQALRDRNESMRAKFAWCITCWATTADLNPRASLAFEL